MIACGEPVETFTVAAIIRDMVATWEDGQPRCPMGINSGECGDFADLLLESLISAGRTEVVAIDSGDLVEDGAAADYWHVWIYFDGRHYDAEAPDGVEDWEQLPFFARWRRDASDAMTKRYVRRRRPEDEAKAFRGLARCMAKTQARISRELAQVKLARHLAMCNGCKIGPCGVGDALLITAWG